MKKEPDINKLAKLVSVQYLLSSMLQAYSIEMTEYMKECGLQNAFRNDINILNRNFDFFGKKVRTLITNEESKKNLFQDFDKLREVIEDFLHSPK